MRLQCASRRRAARTGRIGFNGTGRAGAVACWWRTSSTGRSRIAHIGVALSIRKAKAAGGTCGNAHRFTDGDATDHCVAVPPVRQGGPAIAVRGRYPCANERRWAWKAASALAVTGPPPLLRRWRRTAISCHSRQSACGRPNSVHPGAAADLGLCCHRRMWSRWRLPPAMNAGANKEMAWPVRAILRPHG